MDEYEFIKENIYNGNIIAKRKGKVIHYGKLESFEWNEDPCALN